MVHSVYSSIQALRADVVQTELTLAVENADNFYAIGNEYIHTCCAIQYHMCYTVQYVPQARVVELFHHRVSNRNKIKIQQFYVQIK